MMRRCFYFILFVIVAVSQTDAPCVEGFVTSDLASTIPDARVGIDSLTRGFHRETSTSSSGYYLLDDLMPGAYSVWAEVKGMGCIIYPHVALNPGQRLRQDFYFARAKRYPGNCEPLETKPK